MSKKEKKIDVKKVAKVGLSKEIAEFLAGKGYEISTEYADYGFTEGTIVASLKDTDVQIKFVTPKAGVARYEVEVEEVPAETPAE